MTGYNKNEYDDLEDIELDSDGNFNNDTDPHAHKNIPQKKKKTKSELWIQELLSYFKIIVAAIAIAFVFNQFIIVNAKVPSGSMRNTITEGNRLIGFRLSYIFSKPQRLDVVIFKFPDDETQNYVKRIIGIPGDVIEIKEGHVYVNGEKLEDSYIREPMIVNPEVQTFQVPQGHYFMMGDNRNNSNDSRYWKNSFVAEDKILAKVIFKYFDSKPTFQLIK